MSRFISVIGIAVIILIGYVFSKYRKHIPWKTVAWGFGLQFIFAILILLTTPGEAFFIWVNNVIVVLLNCTRAGSEFIFGNLVNNSIPVIPKNAGENVGTGIEFIAKNGSFFAFSVLPTIIFFSSFMSIMYHLGIMQRVVTIIARVMSKTMKTSGSESLSISANIFVGQTEAPLVVKPYIEKMTVSELHAVMTGGFATVAGGVMAAYVGLLSDFIPDIGGHLLAASIMSAPAALAISKIFYPETENSKTAGNLKIQMEKNSNNIIDAAANGASDGLKLALNVAAMLIAFLALVALLNIILATLGSWAHFDGLSLSWIFGKLFYPLAFLLGIPAADCAQMGNLLGTKIMVNEFVAYLHLRDLVAGELITRKTAIVATYALCGFANIGSIGIQLAGIGGIAPSRRHDIAKIGIRALAAGALASFSTACIAGLLLDIPKIF